MWKSHDTKLCDMASFQTKNVSGIVNIFDISIKSRPVYLLSSLPLSGTNSISLKPLLAELAYLAMLFIFQVTHSSSVRHVKNK